MKKAIVGFILVALPLAWCACQNSPNSPSTVNAQAQTAVTKATMHVPTEQNAIQALRTSEDQGYGRGTFVSFKEIHEEFANGGRCYVITGIEVMRLSGGELSKITTGVIFWKTEKGWRGPDNNIY